MARDWKKNLFEILSRFRSDKRAQVAVIFAITATALVAAAGAGLDLARAYVSRQELSHVAALTCQYSSRPSVVAVAYNGASGPATYTTQVDNFATTALQNQIFQQVQTNSAPFSYTLGGASSVSVAASVPTLFMQIIGVNNIPVGVTVSCSTAQVPPSGSVLINESFENSTCAGTCYAFYNSAGGTAPPATPTTTANNKVAYVGTKGNQWSVTGYCAEIDAIGIINSTVPDGTHSLELDCDNGTGTAGNSAISTKVYLATGNYELRYSYRSRLPYPNYDPAYICGSTATDLAWANDTYAVNYPFYSTNYGARSNQINVYLDQDQSGLPPTHTTIDGTQTLAGSNLIDNCVQSINWIQRSVLINVTTAGYYWLSFAADGKSDSYGGQIDSVLFCTGTCTGSVQDNFPSTWTNANLFEDTFEIPVQGLVNGYSTTTLNASYGTTGSTSNGWPAQAANGWATAPYNVINYYFGNGYQGAFSYQGRQSIQLDVYSGSSTSGNKTISRHFYLDPGYYQVTYDYISNMVFPSVPGQYCVTDPTSPFSQYGYTGNVSGTNRFSGGSGSFGNDTNALAVFMSHSMMASYPVAGGVFNSTTSYTNPDGTTSTTPTVAPDALNINTYNGSQVNPLLDYCGYSGTWLPRTTYIKITKPGMYWLTFAAKGTSDNIGADIDDVKLTGLNSLYGTAPSFSITIPTPSAAPGSTISFTGFYITADRLTP